MKKNILLYLVVVTALAVSCSQTDDSLSSQTSAQKVFHISVESYADSLPGTRADNGIEQLTAAIYNSNGERVRNVAIAQSVDLSELSVEGLPIGSYTLAVMGIGQMHSQVTITPPQTIDGTWLPELNDAPQDNEYLYARSEFTINNQPGMTVNITLNRIVGRVDISPLYPSGQGGNGAIRRIHIAFENGATYSTHNVLGNYGGATEISDYQLANHLCFYSLPTTGDAERGIKLTLVRELGDGETKSYIYEFAIKVEANKRAILRPKVNIENDQFGTIRIYDNDRTSQNSRLFFQDGDSYRVTCNRKFNPNRALVFNPSGNDKVVASFYSILPGKDITVWAKHPNDREYFELAWIESILALEDRTIAVSAEENKLYRTQSGGVVTIEKIDYSRLSYKYESSDPLIQKLATITWPMHVGFQAPDADTLYNAERYLPLRPVHAREMVALFMNMGYVVSHQKWRDAIIAQDNGGGFWNDNRHVSYVNEVEPRMWNPNYSPNRVLTSLLNRSHRDNPWEVWGMALIGDGKLYSLRQETFLIHYEGTNYGLVPPYHEYAHTMGYSHTGNMTNGAWEDICQDKHRELIPELPFPSASVLNSAANPNLYSF